MPREHIHFVTGKLAAASLRSLVARLADEQGFSYSIDVLPITVAALMSPAWAARKIKVAPATTWILLPGYCAGDLAPLQEVVGEVPLERGPRDLRKLPEYFGRRSPDPDYGQYDIEVIAEINHCPRLSWQEIEKIAKRYIAAGADRIDLGCDLDGEWQQVGDTVQAVLQLGVPVAIDSFNPREVTAAVAAGASLVLSVNSQNRERAVDWGCEVVVIPDDISFRELPWMEQLEETVEFLEQSQVPYRMDPILEPVGFGLADSLRRYVEVRERFAEAEMMMGIGNLTELTDVDSAGINTLLIGCCQELGIRSVLTTEVINWARSSVQECSVARQLMYYAVNHYMLPKHLETRLLMLRDAQVTEPSAEELQQLAEEIKDANYRLFTHGGEVHLVGKQLHLAAADPFALMQRLLTSGPQGTAPKNVDASHAFYLGYEMCKAITAITLGKQYDQDEPLDWGLLTRAEQRHPLHRTAPRSPTNDPS